MFGVLMCANVFGRFVLVPVVSRISIYGGCLSFYEFLFGVIFVSGFGVVCYA